MAYEVSSRTSLQYCGMDANRHMATSRCSVLGVSDHCPES